jgi:TolB protein
MPPILSRRVFLVTFAALAAISAARAAQPATPNVILIDSGERPIAVGITADTPALADFAKVAFDAHGRYQRAVSNAQFDLRFSAAGTNQVRVEARQGGALVLNETATGTSQTNALLRAADLVVKATSQLNGFFASRLAFVAGTGERQDIYSSDLFFNPGAVVQRHTQDRAAAFGPNWSPDGKRIIYKSNRSGLSWDIRILNFATMGIEDFFVNKNGGSFGARFSPDGQRVAMVLSGEGQQEVYVSPASSPARPERLTRSDTVKSAPCWSPDGARLVFTQTDARVSGTSPQLYLMSAAGGSPQRIVTGFSYAAEPDWSRGDPDKIAFTVQEGRNYQIAVLSLSGKFAPKVVSKKVPHPDAIEPAWLADGRHLVCTGKAAGVRVLYLLDTESGKATRLSPPSLGECTQASVWGP